MQSIDRVSDCQYCSQVSQANGEDPIGSAPQVDHWLLVEVKQPWTTTMFVDHPVISRAIATVKTLSYKRGVVLMLAAIAPDPDYSKPGLIRVIYYHRPARKFAAYAKQEFLIPEDQASQLVFALLDRLLGKTVDLAPFIAYQQNTQDLREMLVCTHTQVDLACGRFGTPLYRQLRKTYGQPNQSLRVWQSSHFGGHRFAPTLIDLPTGQVWGHLKPEILPQLVEHRGDPHQMRRFLRGWAGCSQFEQIAEREVWMKEGWAWFTYPRTTRMTRKGLVGLKRWLYPVLRWVPHTLLQLGLVHWTSDASWVEVEISYSSSEGNGVYHITIEENGEVMSARKSAAEKDQKISMMPVKQYRVSRLVKQ